MPDHDGALEKRMSVRPYVIFPVSFLLLRLAAWLLLSGWKLGFVSFVLVLGVAGAGAAAVGGCGGGGEGMRRG